MTDVPDWWAKGLIFENCNCQLLCRAHISWKQVCDYERCLGYWAFHVKEGAFGDIPLGGLNAFSFLDMPQVMADGGGTQAIYIDERAGPEQRRALEAILAGEAGAGFAVLAGFISHRLQTRYAPIRFEDEGRRKSVRIEGLLEGSVEAIKGDDRESEVRIENIHNQVFGPSQVLCQGNSQLKDGALELDTKRTHAVYAEFSWKGP